MKQLIEDYGLALMEMVLGLGMIGIFGAVLQMLTAH